MGNKLKSYILIGMLLSIITKFPVGSFENIVSILAIAFILAYFEQGVKKKQEEDSVKQYVEALRKMGYHEDADRIEEAYPIKKSFWQGVKEEVKRREDEDERF